MNSATKRILIGLAAIPLMPVIVALFVAWIIGDVLMDVASSRRE